MPLKKGFSKEVIAANLHELKHSKTKRPPKQRLAIALSTADKSAMAAGRKDLVPKEYQAKTKSKPKSKGKAVKKA